MTDLGARMLDAQAKIGELEELNTFLRLKLKIQLKEAKQNEMKLLERIKYLESKKQQSDIVEYSDKVNAMDVLTTEIHKLTHQQRAHEGLARVNRIELEQIALNDARAYFRSDASSPEAPVSQLKMQQCHDNNAVTETNIPLLLLAYESNQSIALSQSPATKEIQLPTYNPTSFKTGNTKTKKGTTTKSSRPKSPSKTFIKI